MDTAGPVALHTLTKQQILGECLDAVFRARIELDCDTPEDDPIESFVNVHLARVLSQGFYNDGRSSLPDGIWNLRQTLLQYQRPEIRRRQVLNIGSTCLFVYSQQESSRTSRHGQITSVDRRALVSLGRQAYALAAAFESDVEYRQYIHRLSDEFTQYGWLTHHAGMIMGFHDEPAGLIDPAHPIATLEDVLEAFSRFQQSPTRTDWLHLQQTVEQHRWYHPDIHMDLPPEPEENAVDQNEQE